MLETFTTIIPLYVIDEYGRLGKGNGKEVGIQNRLIMTMITIDDPTTIIKEKLAEQAKAAEAAEAAKPHAKTITYDLGNGPQSDTTGYIQSKDNMIIQKNTVGGATIIIKTYPTPVNVDQLVKDVIKHEFERIVPVVKGERVVTRADGSKITVYAIETIGKYEIAAFAPDTSTFVVISQPGTIDDNLLKTLKIGPVIT